MRRLLPVFFLAAFPAVSQLYRPGPQVVTFFSEVDDSDQPYGLYLPGTFNPAKKYPLVISLHGAGSNHRLNLRREFGQGNRPGESDPEATRYFPPLKDVDYIVASPLARGTMGFQGIAERDVLAQQQAALDAVNADAREVVGRIAFRSFSAVRAQFYRLVLKADVGVIDVAWSRKRERLDKIQQLSQQKANELQQLDRDFKTLLREAD